MPKRSLPGYALWVAIPLLTALNQAFIKLLAETMEHTGFGWEWLSEALLTPWVAGILICEIVSFVLWLMILAETGISKAVPITGVAYLIILAMSWTIFEEAILPLQIIGSALILGGVWLIGTGTKHEEQK